MLSHFCESSWTDCSPLGSSVHGILQARILRWVAMPSAGDLPNPGIEPVSVTSPEMAVKFFTTSATWEAQSHVHPSPTWIYPSKLSSNAFFLAFPGQPLTPHSLLSSSLHSRSLGPDCILYLDMPSLLYTYCLFNKNYRASIMCQMSRGTKIKGMCINRSYLLGTDSTQWNQCICEGSLHAVTGSESG